MVNGVEIRLNVVLLIDVNYYTIINYYIIIYRYDGEKYDIVYVMYSSNILFDNV